MSTIKKLKYIFVSCMIIAGAIFILSCKQAGLQSTHEQQLSAPVINSIEKNVFVDPDNGEEQKLSIRLKWKVSDFGTYPSSDRPAEIARFEVYWQIGNTVSADNALNSGNPIMVSSDNEGNGEVQIFPIEFDTTYAILVVVINTGGLSAETKTIVKTSDTYIPSSPVINNIRTYSSALEAYMELDWDAPYPGFDKKELTITEYSVYWLLGEEMNKEEANVKRTSPNSGGGGNIEIKGLDFEQNYAIVVVAENNLGFRAESEKIVKRTSAQAASIPPESVKDFAAEIQDLTAIRLTWEAATNFGITDDGISPAAFKEYIISWTPKDVSSENLNTVGTASIGDATVNEYIIPEDSLKGNSEYEITIVVVNTDGLRSAPASVIESTPNLLETPKLTIDTVSPEIIDNKEATAQIFWTLETPGRHADGEEGKIRFYQIYWKEGATVDENAMDSLLLQETSESIASASITGLIPGKTYSVIVVAVNDVGVKFVSESYKAVIPASRETAPSKPSLQKQSEQPTASDVRVTLSWEEPDPGFNADGSTAEIAEYIIYWKEDGWADGTNVEEEHDGALTAPKESRSIQIQNLKHGKMYGFILLARSINHRSTQSEVLEITTSPSSAARAPDEVRNLRAVKDSSFNIKLTWDPAQSFGMDNNGNPASLQGYEIFVTQGNQASIVLPVTTVTLTTYTIPASSLEGGEQYAIAVVAVNTAGISGPATQVIDLAHDFSTPPGEIDPTIGIQVDTTNTEINSLRVFWPPVVDGLDNNGNPAKTVYSIYISKHNMYGNTDMLIQGVAVAETNISLQENSENVEYTFFNLEANILYDVVVEAVSSSRGNKRSGLYMQRALRSNGVSGVVMQYNGRDAESEISMLAVNQNFQHMEFELAAQVNAYNILDESVEWEIDDKNIVEFVSDITDDSEQKQRFRILRSGLTTITVKSSADPLVSDFIVLSAEKAELKGDLLNYNVESFVVTEGIQTIFELNQESTSILDSISIEYSITSVVPQSSGFSVNTDGSIVVRSSVKAPAEYLVTITALVDNEDIRYWGIQTKDIIIQIVFDTVVYKAEEHPDAQVFSIGDMNNPYLYSIYGLTAEDEDITGSLTITSAGNQVYTSTKINTFYKENELRSVGIGTPEFPFVSAAESAQGDGVSLPFSALADVLTMDVEIRENGQLFAKKTMNIPKGDPGSIYGWRDLYKVEENLDGSYILQHDVTFPDRGNYGFEKFLPIAGGKEYDFNAYLAGQECTDADAGFTGIFDGNDNSIKNIFIEEPNLDFVALFGIAKAATLKNLNIVSSKVQGRFYVGTLVGCARNIEIQNVNIKDGYLLGSYASGGIAGYVWDSNVEGSMDGILDLRYMGDSRIPSGSFGPETGGGGLVGRIKSTQVYGSAHGTLNSNALHHIGGLVGWAGGNDRIVGYTDININAPNAIVVGGLVGMVRSDVEIIGYTSGDITGGSDTGGAVGWSLSNSKVTGYSIGTVTMGAIYSGGFIGESGGKSLGYSRSNVYYTGSRQITNHHDKFGKFAGSLRSGGGYHSAASDESNIFDISPTQYGEGRATGSKGYNGVPVSINVATDENYKDIFSLFTFGTSEGEWVWLGDGHWPAINIGNVQPVHEQPTH